MALALYKWLLVAGLFSTNPAPVHPFFVSVSELNYNSTDKTLEISCKVFTDDFETTLKNATKFPVDMYKPKDSTQLENFISTYIQKHLQIKLDGKPVKMEYVGHELEQQSTWNYFQITNIPAPPRKIEIFNDIFHESFDKQINIMHVTINGNRKSLKLDYPSTEAKFEF